MVLDKNFYQRDTDLVAKELLGKIIVRKTKNALFKARIVETEAYFGLDDPASHARFGKTKRNNLMFDSGGKVYVYLIYGMYHCLNFTSDKLGNPGAVLIRAVEPVWNIDIMQRNRAVKNKISISNGPGKLCQALEINRNLNSILLYSESSEIYVLNENENNRFDIESSKRIGVKKDLDKHFRFFIKNNIYISK